MSKKINIGIITAYGFARLAGYTGTKQEFEQGLRDSAECATHAAQSEENSEAWAKGTRGGTAVIYGDETFHNNSKYWAEQSAHISTGIRLDSYSSLIPADRDGKTTGEHKLKVNVYATKGQTAVPMTLVSVSIFEYEEHSGGAVLPGAVSPLVMQGDTDCYVEYTIPANVYPDDAGKLTFKFQVEGTTYQAVHAWALAKDGEKGDKGDTGEVTQVEFDALAARVATLEDLGLYRDNDGDLCEVDEE